MSDPLDEKYMIEHEHIHSFLYTEWKGWGRCMAEIGCVERHTSTLEHEALVALYESTNGNEWRFNDNWLEGDPCVNQWYGVGCNTEGNIISLHFYENHLVGPFPQELEFLVNLKHLSIFNGDRSYEGKDNHNANWIYYLPSKWRTFTEMEELNLSWININGTMGEDFLVMTKLRFINLSNNNIEGVLPTQNILSSWSQLTRLEIIEVQNNKLSGFIFQEMSILSELTYVNFSNNNLVGTLAILENAQKLEGFDASGNQIQRFPIEYFVEDKFQRLEFINVNFNDKFGMFIPEACKRFAYCFKRTLVIGKDGNDLTGLSTKQTDIIERSKDEIEFPQGLI